MTTGATDTQPLLGTCMVTTGATDTQPLLGTCMVCDKPITKGGMVTVDLHAGEHVVRCTMHVACATHENCRVAADRWLELNSTR